MLQILPDQPPACPQLGNPALWLMLQQQLAGICIKRQISGQTTQS